MESLIVTLSAGFLFVGSVILFVVGMMARSDLMWILGILFGLISACFLLVPIFKRIFNEEKPKTEVEDSKDDESH